MELLSLQGGVASAAPPRGERKGGNTSLARSFRRCHAHNNSAAPWRDALPAGVLVLLAVHEGAGLQLAAHQGGAVVAHGRVPRRALCLGVAVDAGDWREEKAVSFPLRPEEEEDEDRGGTELYSA